mmetsp:Transcript_12193/g.16999  ORF Transcript_12193/g.16999 Transcript_12193/m.16999 type:complete len:149 (+) Transcript_12193:1-447(+)
MDTPIKMESKETLRKEKSEGNDKNVENRRNVNEGQGDDMNKELFENMERDLEALKCLSIDSKMGNIAQQTKDLKELLRNMASTEEALFENIGISEEDFKIAMEEVNVSHTSIDDSGQPGAEQDVARTGSGRVENSDQPETSKEKGAES